MHIACVHTVKRFLVPFETSKRVHATTAAPLMLPVFSEETKGE